MNGWREKVEQRDNAQVGSRVKGDKQLLLCVVPVAKEGLRSSTYIHYASIKRVFN